MSEPHERWRVGPLRDPEFKKVSVLIATAMIDMIGFAIIFPLLPFYAIELNASPFAIGWIMASFSVAQLGSAPLGGRVCDRHGRRPAVLAGLAASGIAYLVFGYATSLWVLLLSRLVQGAGGGTTAVLHAYVGDAIRPERRAQALGWISAATGLGVSVGPRVMGGQVRHRRSGHGGGGALPAQLRVYLEVAARVPHS